MNLSQQRATERTEKTLGEKIVQKLNYLVPAIFILAGLGVISGVLFSEGALGGYRVVFGAIILVYGLVRLWSVKQRERRER